MKLAKLDEMVKGWFVGNFKPTCINTSNVEVAVKKYQKGETEDLSPLEWIMKNDLTRLQKQEAMPHEH